MAGKRDRQLRETYPAEPWRWRADWCEGRAESTTRSLSVGFPWVFAFLWNLASFPMLFVIPAALQRGNQVAAIGLLFPLIGVGLVAHAISATLRFRKFGVSVFEMEGQLFSPGGRMVGRIRANRALLPPDGFHLRLTCVRRSVSGSGENRSVSEKILWRGERTMSRPLPGDDPERTLVPVSFEIPPDAPTTTFDDADDRVLWILDATARAQGPEYRAEFEVPVFRKDGAGAVATTADATTAPTTTDPVVDRKAAGPDPMAAYEAPERSYRPGDDPGILVRPSAGGGTEFFFSAARNPGPAAGWSAFVLIWCGSFWLVRHFHAPLIFPIVIALSGLVLLLVSLDLWLGTTRVVIESGVVRLTRGLLGVGPTRLIPCSEIKDTRLTIGMQSGDHSGTPYYTLNLVDTDDRIFSAGSYLKNKEEAEWLAAEMKRLALSGR